MNLPIKSQLRNVLQAIHLTFRAVFSMKRIVCIVAGWEPFALLPGRNPWPCSEFSTSEPLPLRSGWVVK